MDIIEVELAVTDPDRAAAWYRDVLEFEVEGRTVRVGATTLILRADVRVNGTPHLALDIPTARFDEARRWLEQRVTLQRNAEGREEFEGPPGWDSRSLYFEGGAGEILELIARAEIEAPAAAGPFTGAEIMHVSEVGVALPDASPVRKQLRAVGIDDYHTTVPAFAPLGDARGLLIAVAPGRPWAPEGKTRAEVSPLRILVRTSAAGTVALNELAQLVARAN